MLLIFFLKIKLLLEKGNMKMMNQYLNKLKTRLIQLDALWKCLSAICLKGKYDTGLMQHEISSSKGNVLRSSEKYLNESIEICSSVSGQGVQKCGAAEYFNVNCQRLHLGMTIWFSSLTWKHQVFLQKITSKGSDRFCYWGFWLWGPCLFSKNWIETVVLFMLSHQESEM